MTTNADGTLNIESQPNPEAKPGEGLPAGEVKPTLPIAEKQPEAKPTDGPIPVVYEATGDPALDMALEFVGKFGFGPEDPAMVAAGDGNFALLEAKLAAMGDKAKGYEKFIALGKSSYAQVSEKAKAAAAEKATAIYNVVGGESQWKVIQAWAATNAEPAEQEAVNAALAGSPMQAKAMAHYLATLYDRASGVNQTGRKAVNENGPAGGSPQNGALTPRAYTKEVDALKRKLGSKMEESNDYKQLIARRQAWRP